MFCQKYNILHLNLSSSVKMPVRIYCISGRICPIFLEFKSGITSWPEATCENLLHFCMLSQCMDTSWVSFQNSHSYTSFTLVCIRGGLLETFCVHNNNTIVEWFIDRSAFTEFLITVSHQEGCKSKIMERICLKHHPFLSGFGTYLVTLLYAVTVYGHQLSSFSK